MSVCTFLAANCPLAEAAPAKEYPVHINLDNGTVDDGDADDHYYLHPFDDAGIYTDKENAVRLEWLRYTKGRAKQLLNYIKDALRLTDCVEIWRVWLGDYYESDEHDERPAIKKLTVPIAELALEDIREIDRAEIWNNSNKNKPSFYCLRIVR